LAVQPISNLGSLTFTVSRNTIINTLPEGFKSARRKSRYLYNKHKIRKLMPSAGFEPVIPAGNVVIL